MNTFPSKTWSCGSLVHAAAEVADQMAAPAADLEAEREKVLLETMGMDVEELTKLLQETWLYWLY